MEISETDLAYSAGFFDGEGCIDIRHRFTHGGKYERFELRVQIVQIRVNVLHWHKERFGGLIDHPSKTSKCHRWLVVEKQAATYLKLILPYLQGKRAEALLAIEFIGTRARIWNAKHRMTATTPEVREKRLQCFLGLRELRAKDGISPSGNRKANSNEIAIRGLNREDANSQTSSGRT